MKISILIPSRNNLEFLKLAYSSIRKNQGNHFVEILVLDDKSDKDNTWEWCQETMDFDLDFKAFKNNLPERLGISSGYKFLSQQASQDVICHWHADMVMTKDTLTEVERELFEMISFSHDNSITGLWPLEKKAVCLTRIEPPIYNKPGVYPEKIIWKDGPVEIEDWNESFFALNLPSLAVQWSGKRTAGHFAPFFMFREEYNKLGGNDVDNFPKQAREDSDFGFRLVLAGFETIQIPHFVYHFASRGNRRSKHESGNFVDNPEWQQIEKNSVRNFIRKWGTLNLHKSDLTPNKPVKYSIGFKVINCNYDLLHALEPWCSKCIAQFDDSKNLDSNYIAEYINNEQQNTKFDLSKKLTLDWGEPANDIWIEIDGHRFDQYDFTNIQHLSEIITASGEIGTFTLGNLKITINAMEHCENDLIVCNNEPIQLN